MIAEIPDTVWAMLAPTVVALLIAVTNYVGQRTANDKFDSARKADDEARKVIAAKLEVSQVAAVATSATVEKIHTEVNHERTVMLEELRRMRDLVLSLTEERTSLREQKRSQELASALATAPGQAGPLTADKIAQIVDAVKNNL